MLFSFVNKGGTTDITVYKLQEDKAITELVATGSEEWGGTNVDEAYRQFLEDIYGNDVLETFNSDPEYFIDDFEYRYYFESKKIESSSFSFNHNTKMRLVTPVVLSEILFKKQRSQRVFHDDLLNALLKKSKYCYKDITVEAGKLRMSKDLFKSFFNPTIDKLIAHLSKMFKDKLYSDIETVLIVGGFSECQLVQEQLKHNILETPKV